MANLKEIEEAKFVMSAQSNILKNINNRLDNLENIFDIVDEHKTKIKELDRILTRLENNSDNLDYSDLSEWDDEKIFSFYSDKKKHYKEEIQTLNYKNWDQFVKESFIYCTNNNIEATLPYEIFLTETDLKQISNESYMSQYKWDKWDYAFVGTAGFLASIIDFFLVKTPQTIKYKGKVYEGSPITEFLKKHINSENEESWFANFAKDLEDRCKVPYDAVNDGLSGMTGRTHRFQSFGHDPVLGCVFGVIDILRGTLSGFSYDMISHTHKFVVKQITQAKIQNLIEACLIWFGHLISDVGTKSGLQPPFFTFFQGINLTSPFSPKNKKIGEIARWMYLNGYDFRHFITMGITPAVIEIVLRTYIMLKHYNAKGEVNLKLASNPKYRSMLLWSHAIATAGNAGKIIFQQGNPLAINYNEWLAFFRYLTPSIKYWVFDKQRLEIEHLKKINDTGWNELLKTTDSILDKIYFNQLDEITL